MTNVMPVVKQTAGHIQAALAAGVPQELLVPILPPNADPARFDHRKLGKMPAHYDGNTGEWYGASTWHIGTWHGDLLFSDQAGANVGIRCGVPAEGWAFYLFDIDVQLLDGEPNGLENARALCGKVESCLSEVLGGAPFRIRKTHIYRSMVAVAVKGEAPVGTKEVRSISCGEREVLKLELLAKGQQGVIGGLHMVGPITWHPYGQPDVKSRTISIAPDAVPRFDTYAQVLQVLDALCGKLTAENPGLTMTTLTRGVTRVTDSNHQEGHHPPRGEAPPGGVDHMVSVLQRMHNGPKVSREKYVAVMLSVVGAIRALERQNRIDASGMDRVRQATCEWAVRWSSKTTLEAEFAKFDDDWLGRYQPLKGWGSLLREAKELTPELAVDFAIEDAEYQFGNAPLPEDNSTAGVDEGIILSHETPLKSARSYIQRHYFAEGMRTLQHQQGSFHGWCGTHYVEIAKEEMLSKVWKFLDRAKCGTGVEAAPFNPTGAKVKNVVEALAAEAQLPSVIKPPAWLDLRSLNPADSLIVCRNGLLDVSTRQMLPHTPAIFAVNALDFDYDVAAPVPEEWLKFLSTLWPNDSSSIATLQEFVGLLLTGKTLYQKALLMVGPPRSGKGTIAHIISCLLGPDNICGLMFRSLSQNFGLEPLIGKRLAIVPDARVGGVDQQAILEKLLSIIGEDTLTIDRKNKSAWTGRLQTRVVILSNELPRLGDASGALSSRFVTLMLRESFLGREDLGLKDRLVPELSGIVLWGLAGLDRLTKRGHFIQPDSAAEARLEFEDLCSPMSAFLRERCVIGANRSVKVSRIFGVWQAWCREGGREHPGTIHGFARDIRAALPALTTANLRNEEGGRDRFYNGLDVKEDFE